MKMFQLTNYDEFIAIHQATYGLFGTTSLGQHVHIGGYRESNGTWFVDGTVLYRLAGIPAIFGRCVQLYLDRMTIFYNGVNCSLTSNTFCEIVRVQPPKRVIKPSACRNKTDIIDTNLNYVKTACVIKEQGNYYAETALCQFNGMSPIQIRYSYEFEQLKALTAGAYLTPQMFFIDGSKGSVWMTGGLPVFSGANPIVGTGDVLIANTTHIIAGTRPGPYRIVCQYD
jgi:hypothetical protein